MELEDQQRFAVVPYSGVVHGYPFILLSCDRCPWTAELDDAMSLAELVQRAGEHGEVCR